MTAEAPPIPLFCPVLKRYFVKTGEYRAPMPGDYYCTEKVLGVALAAQQHVSWKRWIVTPLKGTP